MTDDAISEEMVEAVAKALFAVEWTDCPGEWTWEHMVDDERCYWFTASRAALEAALPLIVAKERERCAKIADQTGRDISLCKIILHKNTTLKRTINSTMIGTAQNIAAAIRSGTGGDTP